MNVSFDVSLFARLYSHAIFDSFMFVFEFQRRE